MTDPKKRIKAKAALEHPWFSKFCPVVVLSTVTDVVPIPDTLKAD
jgi:hypothetical protein